jgi:hypothetical protein
MRIASVFLLLLISGCDKPQGNSRYEYVSRPQFEGHDFVFDRQSGCLAEIQIDVPKEVSAAQFAQAKAVPETVKGFEEWKCPKSEMKAIKQ